MGGTILDTPCDRYRWKNKIFSNEKDVLAVIELMRMIPKG